MREGLGKIAWLIVLLFAGVMLASVGCCKPCVVTPPKIVEVQVPVKGAVLFLPARGPLPIKDIREAMPLAEREKLMLATIRQLIDRSESLEAIIKSHNKSMDNFPGVPK